MHDSLDGMPETLRNSYGDGGKAAPFAPGNRESRVDALRALLSQADAAYHGGSQTIMDDGEYDSLRRELRELEGATLPSGLPGLSPGSLPADDSGEGVGAPLPEGVVGVQHLVSMMSLENAFTAAEIQAWSDGLAAHLGLPPGTALHCVSEPKMDGLSLSLLYNRGVLVRGATRGDGTSGEDVTAAVLRMASVPKRLNGVAPDVLEVRGEAYIPLQDFLNLNTRLQDGGAKVFSNPRNAAAGTLRHSDPAVVGERGLRFMAYGLGVHPDGLVETQQHLLARLARWGFEVTEYAMFSKGVDEMMSNAAFLGAVRPTPPYEVDGMVHKLDSMAMRERAGATSRAPRWAVAWKFEAESATTVLEGISVGVGRTGVLTPVAELRPVSVGGVTVSRASLHNGDRVAALDLRVGDTVLVKRAGDVIPLVTGYIEALRPEGTIPWSMPAACPGCGAPALRLPGTAAHRCTGGLSCGAQVAEGLCHAASRDALDVPGLGPEGVQALREAGFLGDLACLFALPEKEGEIAKPEGWGGKRAAALAAGVRRMRRELPAWRLLAALGIPGMGRTTCIALCQCMPNPEDMMAALAAAGGGDPDALREVMDVEGIGPGTASAVAAFFSVPSNLDVLARLDALVELAKPASVTEDGILPRGPLEGTCVAFTGILQVPRAKAEARARSLGAKVASVVGPGTTLLVAGPKAGSKLAKAARAGTRVVSEEEWNRMCTGSASGTP